MLVAVLAGAPGLRVPFLSDDWSNLAAVAQGIPHRTPFGYFRPLYLATLRADLLVWGLKPAGFHLTNLAFIVGSAAVVVALVRRYSGSAEVAGIAGLLFALHPHHVECAAWIAGRGDSLATLLLLGAALAFDRWRTECRGFPLAAAALFVGGVLTKESAVLLPLFLLCVAYAIPGRRPSRSEWLRGHLVLATLAGFYVIWMHRVASEGTWSRLLMAVGVHWIKSLLYFCAATLAPAHVEVMEHAPVLWGAVATLAGVALLVAARRGSGKVPMGVWIGAAAFVVLLGFSVFSFQERYLFMPSAASAAAVAFALVAARPRPRRTILTVLCAGWLWSIAWHWNIWGEAGRVSTRLIEDLARISRAPGVAEILVANMPHSVHGIPVAANFRDAVGLVGRRVESVRAVVYVDYPNPAADSLDGSVDSAIRFGASSVEVSLRAPEEIFSGYVISRRPAGAPPDPMRSTVVEAGDGRVTVRIPFVPGRTAAIWRPSGLESLF